MKYLLLAVLCFFSASSAFAAKNTNSHALEIIKRIEQKRARFKTKQALVKILKPESIKAGDPFSFYFQSNTEISGTNSLISLEIDGGSAEIMEQPAKGLFIYHSSGLTEIKTHTAVANLSIEDAAESKSIRDAIQQLDTEIAALQDQIDDQEDEGIRNGLIAQRDEKIGIKAQLVAALSSIATSLGHEDFSFSISAAADENPDYFRITSVAPSVGNVIGGTVLNVTGLRFPEGLDGKLGGLPVAVTRISATELSITSPNFGSEVGIKSLELRLPGAAPSDPVKNATLSNAFYAANISDINVKPVAVAGSAQSVVMGTVVSMDGLASYDENPGTTLLYAWTPISVPPASGIATGVVYNTSATFDFTPSKPGSYVWQLVVSDGILSSSPSLTVVNAEPLTNSAPVPTSSAISAVAGATVNRQIAHGDPDTYQAHSYLITKQSTLGTATVSSTGLISFTAGSTSGSDSIDVLVMDNGTPPLSASLSIPVSIAASEVTVGDSYYEIFSRDGLIHVGLGADTITSSNGDIASATWSFGDGTSQPVDTDELLYDGAFMFHDYVAIGTYTATLTVIDSLGASSSTSVPVVITNDAMPVAKIAVDNITGSVPLTVAFDGTASSDDVGITQYQWDWADGSSRGNTSTATHTFTDAGEYQVRLKINDAESNRATTYVTIYAGVTPPTGGSKPMADIRFGAKEVTLGTAHTFSAANSFDPNPSGSISSYNWNFGDNYTCDWSSAHPGCIATGVTTSYTYPDVGNYKPAVVVENAGGAFSNTSYGGAGEVFVVNSGHSPRAVENFIFQEVAAPYTINMDASGSFDYDGTISSYLWQFNDPSCTSGCTSTNSTASHTYGEGLYWITLDVKDNDNNVHQTIGTLLVDPSGSVIKAKARRLTALDREREQRRRMLSEACFNKQASACYEVGKMYQEDGNSFAANKFFEKACALGYTAACSVSFSETKR